MTMKKEEKYEDFVNDWEIDNKLQAATHKTGLHFSYAGSLDGKPNYIYKNVIAWRRDMHRQGLSNEQTSALFAKLNMQFQEIHKRMPDKAPYNAEAFWDSQEKKYKKPAKCFVSSNFCNKVATLFNPKGRT